MQNLERRISVLEKKESKLDTVVFIKSVEPGHLKAEVSYLTDGKGLEWTRADEEPEAAFKHRASAEVPRNKYGVSILFNFPMGQSAQESIYAET